MDPEDKKRKLSGGDWNDTKRVSCPACNQNRADYHLVNCPHCHSDFCTRPACGPAHQAAFIADASGHNSCVASHQSCPHCLGDFCGVHSIGVHQGLYAADTLGDICCADSHQQCPHCQNNYCGVHSIGAHQATYFNDFSGDNCCPGSLQQCPHCNNNFCGVHSYGAHQFLYANDGLGHSCCAASHQACPHCGNNFCGVHSVGLHQASFANDASNHNCCPASHQSCPHCHGNFCRTHSFGAHNEINADGCSDKTCAASAGRCGKCGKIYCKECKTDKIKSCDVCSAPFCDLCEPCKKCEGKKESSIIDTSSKSSVDIKPKIVNLGRHISQTIVKESKQSLTLLHLDVDQGACTILLYTSPKGEPWTAVIDGGHGNPGRGQIARYLKKMGKIDALFLSHYDSDHADGLADLIYHHYGLVKGATLYVPQISNAPITQYAYARKIDFVEMKAPIEFDGNFRIEPHRGKAPNPDENGRSLALLISLGKFRYLTCGDLPTKYGEDGVAQIAKSVDALYCSHHGSAHSTSEKMLEILNPAIAVISAGRNGYGHPNSETLERFQKDPNLFRFYLTGCQYNRKYVNPTYYDTELENLTKRLETSWITYSKIVNSENAKSLITAMYDGLFFCEEEKFEVKGYKNGNAQKFLKDLKEAKQKVVNAPDTRSIREVLILSQSTVECVMNNVKACHEANRKNELKIFGYLSGTNKRMGPVGIRIESPYLDNVVDVGFCSSDGNWQWLHRWQRKEKDRLIFHSDIKEAANAIDKAIPEAGEITDSPGTFEGWKKIRDKERNPFILSTRTPRQPDLMVEYRCRWCKQLHSATVAEKFPDVKMVLVDCEYCNNRGLTVAYHDRCLLSAIEGETTVKESIVRGHTKLASRDIDIKRGEKHPLRQKIKELVENRDSDPVVIPAEYEACYFCGLFRENSEIIRFIYVESSIDEDVVKAVLERRGKFKEEKLGEIKYGDVVEFTHDDPTFQKYYETRKFKWLG